MKVVIELHSVTARVLQIIRRSKDPLSKTDIAAESGLSLSAVNDHIERLISDKLIIIQRSEIRAEDANHGCTL